MDPFELKKKQLDLEEKLDAVLAYDAEEAGTEEKPKYSRYPRLLDALASACKGTRIYRDMQYRAEKYLEITGPGSRCVALCDQASAAVGPLIDFFTHLIGRPEGDSNTATPKKWFSFFRKKAPYVCEQDLLHQGEISPGSSLSMLHQEVFRILRPPNKTRTGGSGNKLEWRRV